MQNGAASSISFTNGEQELYFIQASSKQIWWDNIWSFFLA